MANFEKDLKRLKVRLQDDIFAQHLYATLCNNEFIHTVSNDHYSCSWRHAGGLVAAIREKGEDYLDFYCSGNEGNIHNDVLAELVSIGWYALIPLSDLDEKLELPPDFELKT